jgi:hypothetical protein
MLYSDNNYLNNLDSPNYFILIIVNRYKQRLRSICRNLFIKENNSQGVEERQSPLI